MFVSCGCCGPGLMECKCPYSIINDIPCESNLSYLHSVISESGEAVQLKKNHDYYFQVQGQMGVSGRKYCDFFVYTSHGYFLERIEFDDQFWCDVLSKLQWFWLSYIGKELLYPGFKLTQDAREQEENKCSTEISSIIHVTTNAKQQSINNTSENPNAIRTNVTEQNSLISLDITCVKPAVKRGVCVVDKLDENPPKRLKRTTAKGKDFSVVKNTTSNDLAAKSTKRKRVTKRKPTYVCGICLAECIDKPVQENQFSICCNSCSNWYHFYCVKISQLRIPKKWLCRNCNS